MFDDCLALEEDFPKKSPPKRRKKPPVDLCDPQPWFLLFTDPILEEEGEKKDINFPWQPVAPRPITKTKVELQKVLDFICKPYRFVIEGQRYRQQVSDKPVNRTYVQNLYRGLELSLRSVKSSNTGFCPYRIRIHLDMFSEVVRIVTVMMKERGLILLRVKDDFEATIKTYEELYKNNMLCSIWKPFELEKKKMEIEMKIKRARKDTVLLEEMAEAFKARSSFNFLQIKEEKESVVKRKMLELEILRQIAAPMETATIVLQEQRKLDPYMVSMQEIVNCIVPPREWYENGEMWMQQLSIEPGSRDEMKALISNLDLRLEQLQVRKKGFCPIRSQLYEEAFNELIRQVTLQCAEQGVLLMRIRNESRMTLKAYQSLFENSNAIAVKKIEEVKLSKGNLEERVKDLMEELLQLDNQLIIEQHKYKMVERRTSELMDSISRTQENDLHYHGQALEQIEVITKSISEAVPVKTEET